MLNTNEQRGMGCKNIVLDSSGSEARCYYCKIDGDVPIYFYTLSLAQIEF